MSTSTPVKAMLSSVPRRIGQYRHQPTARVPVVCVVDSRSDDYRSWISQADASGVRILFFATAEEALRFSHTTAVDLWVVNVALPKLSGTELCQILKRQSARRPVYLVADEHSPAAERAAWTAGATIYGNKPAQVDWLNDWLNLWRGRGALCRTGPTPV